MSILEKIEGLMKQKGIKNRKQLSELCGIPYTTIAGFYAKGYDNMKLSTLKTLAAFFGVTIDYLVSDKIQEIQEPTECTHEKIKNKSIFEPQLQDTDEAHLLNNYRKLNEEGQEKVLDYIEDLVDSQKYKKHDSSEMVQEA